jgi:hypothetical protein
VAIKETAAATASQALQWLKFQALKMQISSSRCNQEDSESNDILQSI